MSAAPPTILRLRAVQGEGDVFGAGTRTAHPLIIQVTDETGKPIPDATVGFSLPADGPGGTFAGNMRTDIAISGGDGKAAMSAVQWGEATGPVSLRVTAAKDGVRAGIVVSAYVTESAARTTPVSRSGRGGGWGWKKTALIVGAAAVAGVSTGWATSRKSTPGSAAGTTPSTPSSPIQIGTPSISIGKP